MRTLNITRSCILIGFILASALIAGAQVKTRAELFEQLKVVARTHPLGNEYTGSEMNELIESLDLDATGPVTDSMRIFFETIADSAFYDTATRRLAVSALHLFPAATEAPRVRIFMADSALRIQAAGVLLQWGFWEEASPLLIGNEVWYLLVNGPEERVRPVLNQAASGSKTLMGQISAAQALRKYGDEEAALRTSRQLIRQFIIEKKTPVNDWDMEQAVYVSLETLGLGKNPDDDSLLQSALSSSVPGFRRTAMTLLGRAARRGDSTALEMVKQVAKSSDFPDIAKQAQTILDRNE